MMTNEHIIPPDGPVMLTDGVCNMCNRWVAFLLRHERLPVMRFASLQSRAARELLEAYGVEVPERSETLMLVDAGEVHRRSGAVFRALGYTRAPWRWLRALRLVPGPVREGVYRRISASRYRIGGRSDACPVPDASQRARFLDAREREQGLA